MTKKIIISAIASILFLNSCRQDETVQLPTCVDVSGNSYKVVKIGTQYWMAENLRTTRYRNGDSIPTSTNELWGGLKTGAQGSYNSTTNKDTIVLYGRLYNGYAAFDTIKVAPTGWHIPTLVDWMTLKIYLAAVASYNIHSVDSLIASKWGVGKKRYREVYCDILDRATRFLEFLDGVSFQ